MAVFNLFLEFLALLLSVIGIVLIYLAIDNCKESAFVPVYYFIGMGLAAVALLSLSKAAASIYGSASVLTSSLVQNLLLAYVALFLFGSLWQSYEAELCVLPYVDTGGSRVEDN